jgi:hypothetical protein
MSIVDTLAAGASVASGGLFGVIGAVGSAFIKGRQETRQQAHQLEVMDREHRAAQEGHLQEIRESRQAASAAGLTASIQADASVKGNTWLWETAASIKTLYRPMLTTGLLWMSWLFFQDLMAAAEGTEGTMVAQFFSPEDIVAMIQYIVYSLVFSSSTAVTWWFGERALTPSWSRRM